PTRARCPIAVRRSRGLASAWVGMPRLERSSWESVIMAKQDRPSRGSHRVRRRELLEQGLGGMIMMTGTGRILARDPGEAQPDRGLILEENKRPGSDDWQLTRVRPDKVGFRTPWIEGYCSRQSVRTGEVLDIFVST